MDSENRSSGRKTAILALRITNRICSWIIALILLLALLYCLYGLWDTWSIYAGAGVDSELLKYRPVHTEGDDTSNPSLEDLKETNPDVCAWLTVEDTGIDYPVVQGETNLEYINKDVYGEFSLAGSVFLDCRNQPDFSDYYSLIYAHHMEGNVMFGELPEFQEAEYFQTHTGGLLYTSEHTWQITWFACVATDAYDINVFNPTGYTTEESRTRLRDYLSEMAVQYRELDLSEEDRILGLSTCSDVTTNGRVLLFGRLRREE
jgi:sortase B